MPFFHFALRSDLLCSTLTTVSHTELVNYALTCSPQASHHFDSSSSVVDRITFDIDHLLGQ